MRHVLALFVLLPWLQACGSCLLVNTRPATFTMPDGSTIEGEIDYREPDGLLASDDTPVVSAIIGLLLEPVDMMVSTALAAEAVVTRRESVVAGPFGWLASLTPFATLVPGLHLPPPTGIRIDAAQRIALHDDDPARRATAIAAAAGDHRIVDARLALAEPETLACTLVFLRTGPRPPADDTERRQVFAGHFANMERLARAGDLLVAGPFGEPRHAPDLRGVFVLDTGNPVRARALAETDPTVQAGVFALEYHALTTTAPLRRFLARELAALDAATASGRQTAPGEGIRGFTLLTLPDTSHAERIARHPRVLLTGTLDETRTLALLDAASRDAATALLQELGIDAAGATLDSWFASAGLASLR